MLRTFTSFRTVLNSQFKAPSVDLFKKCLYSSTTPEKSREEILAELYDCPEPEPVGQGKRPFWGGGKLIPGVVVCRKMKKTIFLLLLFLLPNGWFAQANQNRAVVLNHLTVIDVKGAGSRSGMTVIITGNRITEIGRTGKVRIPKDAVIIDAGGKFLIFGEPLKGS